MRLAKDEYLIQALAAQCADQTFGTTIGVWICCLVWMLVLDALKITYWHVIDRQEEELSRVEQPLLA